MPKVYDIGDTIAAISTPMGMGGIGIVRLSGPEALQIADQMFVTRKGVSPSQCSTYTVHYGDVIRRDQGRPVAIDEALLTVMRAPKSYTCEDVVEISCHGGSAAVKAVLKVALGLGARMAGPGEFTKRAFLNGRIDLAQAEAVLDIIRAKTEVGMSVFEHQLKGDLTHRLEDIRQDLMDFYVKTEAAVNFPDEELEGDLQKDISARLKTIEEKIRSLLQTTDQGRIVREGIKIVLCGKVNVGKSSLMNVLLGQPRAIVSPIQGTTRDTIEESFDLNGIPVQMVDTAGFLSPRDDIEEEAIRRSDLHIQDAELVLFLLDASEPLDEQDHALALKLKDKNVFVVINKTDLPSALTQEDWSALFPEQERFFSVSALTREGVDILKEAMLSYILHGKDFEPKNIVLSNVRHIELLQKCLNEVQSASTPADGDLSLEFVSEYIQRAIHELDRITGRDVESDLLDQIFSEFCIGK